MNRDKRGKQGKQKTAPFSYKHFPRNVAGFSLPSLTLGKQGKHSGQHSESARPFQTEILRNDRERQFAIHIKPDPGRPFDEFLILPAMSQAEYLAAINRGEAFRRWLVRELCRFTYAEILVNGDAKDLRHARPVGYSLNCTGWVGFGNECGCTPIKPGDNHQLIL